VAQYLQLQKFVDKERAKSPKRRSRSWPLVARGLCVNRFETSGESNLEDFSLGVETPEPQRAEINHGHLIQKDTRQRPMNFG
jgi:hypothetical protein